MNLSLKIDRKYPNPSGEYPLYVRIRNRRFDGKWEESSIFTDLFIKSSHIKNGLLLRKTNSYHSRQSVIDSMFSEIEKITSTLIQEGFYPNPSLVKKRYEEGVKVKEINTPKVQSFWVSFDEYLSTKKHKSRGYVKTIITLRNRLKDFERWKNVKLNFEYVVYNNKRFYHDFQDYLWSEKKHTNNYVNKLFSNLSHFLHFCKENRYIETKPSFPKVDSVDRDEKIYLYKDEVFKLFKSTKWDYKEGKDYSSNPHIYLIQERLEGTRKKEFDGVRNITNWELVKDIFLFQCSIGCRYSDIPHFKVNHFDFSSSTKTFSWIQQKTDKRVNVPENEISKSVFKKYSRGKSLTQNLFPSLSIQKFNKSLKYLLKDLGFNRLVTYPRKIGSKLINTEERFLWELMSSHSGRRTFIKNMIDLGTMDYKTIMTMTGHKTISEFEKYVSVSPHDLKKGRKLYQMDNPQTDSEVDELVKSYVELDEDKRNLIIQMIRSFK